jgi:hypothetical protein
LPVLTGSFRWLVSEIFFLVSITAFHNMDIQAGDAVVGIGYSAMAVALATIFYFLLISILKFKSLQRYKVGMPATRGS